MKKCARCGAQTLFHSKEITARGGHGPDLLPGIGGLFRWPKLVVLACSSCGAVEFTLPERFRSELERSGKWQRL